MPQPLLLFVPGYAEPGGARTLALRFAHALATGGAGDPLVLAAESVDAVAPPPAWGDQSERAAGGLSALGDDERRLLARVHASILESNARLLRAPESAVLRDPHVQPGADPEEALLAAYFSPLWAYASRPELRYALQDAFKEAVARQASRSLVVVAHGLGALVAYDTLFKLGPSAPPLRMLTAGACIGLSAVQSLLKARPRADGFYPIPDRIRSWVNVTHPFDAVAGDPTLGDEFRWADQQQRIEDRPAQVDTGWPFHRWEGYARSAALRGGLRELLAER